MRTERFGLGAVAARVKEFIFSLLSVLSVGDNLI
jgi:hypothetical protein